MPDATERFIAAATAPMARSPELQITERNELAESIARANEPGADPLERAAEELEREESRTGRWFKMGLYVVTAAISVAALATFLSSSVELRALYPFLSGAGAGPIDPSDLEARLGAQRTPDERLLLLGDTRKSGRSARIKGLWASDPRNPAYFADYATVHGSDHRTLPPDFLKTAKELDPDNGWFIAIAAAMAAQEGIDRNAKTTLTPGGAKLRPVQDQAKLDEAIGLFHQAAQLERFDSYQGTLLKQRILLLPERTDVASQGAPLTYLASMSTLNLRLRHLSEAIAVKANELAKAGDKEGFQGLLEDWEKFVPRYAAVHHTNLVDILLAYVFVGTPLKSLAEAAAELGMPEEARRLQELDRRMEEQKAAIRAKPSSAEEKIGLHSGLLAGRSIPVIAGQTLTPVPIAPEELEPGRMADHAFAGRILSLLGWLVLGLALVASGFFRSRGGPLQRALSASLLRLLRPGDWAWIIGGGILLPFAYYQIITEMTPLGAKEWSLRASMFMTPSGQFGAMISLMIVLPLLIARWRLSRRAGAAGLASRTSSWERAAVVLCILALPCFGVPFLMGGKASGEALIAASCLLAALQLCTLLIGIRALFGRRGQLVRRIALSRIMLPAYATGMLLLAAMTFVYHAAEKHWLAKDTLMMWTVEKPGIGRYEYDAAQQFQKDFLELLEAPSDH